jgi:hypothetical protein
MLLQKFHPLSQFSENVKTKRQNFIDDLKSYTGNQLCQSLAQHLQKEKQLLVHFWKESVDAEYTMAIIHGVNDALLEKLGRTSHHFPRGFVVIWEKTQIQFFGFRPKFNNDTVAAVEKSVNVSEVFVDFWEMEKLNAFCLQHQLPTDSKWKVSRDFMQIIESHRDEMTDELFDQLIAQEVLGTQVQGTITHRETQGNVLEGLVLFSDKQEVEISKKFSGSLGILFGFKLASGRKVFTVNSKNSALSDSNMYASAFAEYISPLLHPELCRDIIDQHLSICCEVLIPSDPHGCVVPRLAAIVTAIGNGSTSSNVLRCTASTQKTMIKFKFPFYTMRTFGLRESLKKPPEERAKHLDMYTERWCFSPKGKAWAKHVLHRALEIVENNDYISAIDKAMVPWAEFEFEKKVSKGVIAVVVVVGPIGCGKSTWAQKLADSDPEHLEHLDGDDLGIKNDVVRCGMERNLLTMARVLELVFKGKVPIISCGGGQFEDIKASLFHAFPDFQVQLDVHFPEQGEGIYDSFDTKSVVKHRLDTGIWTLPQGKTAAIFAQEIAVKSQKNKEHACKLLKQSDHVFVYAREIKSFPKFEPNPVHDQILVHQDRILVEVPDVPMLKHVTMFYSAQGEMRSLSSELFSPRSISGVYVTAFSPDKKHTIVFVSVPELGQGMHVTISPGKHAPALMREAALAFQNEASHVIISGIIYHFSVQKKISVRLVTRFCF